MAFLIMRYVKAALGLPIDELFDYSLPKELIGKCSIGSRVLVPFHRRTFVGYVAGLSNNTKIAKTKIRPILKLIDDKPILNRQFLKLSKLVSSYYLNSWGQTIEAGLPAAVKRGFAVNVYNDHNLKKEAGGFNAILLRYDNYSDCLNFYFEEIDKTIAQKKSVIILFAQIKSALEVFTLLKERYPNQIALTHRKQKTNDELKIWQAAANNEISILFGTRPSVFAPFSNLGLIIIDQEDAYGHKEEQAPYYHARDAAFMRAQLEKTNLILSSKTPSLESYYGQKCGKYKLVKLLDKNANSPKITIADMGQYGFLKKKNRIIFSPVLEAKINKAIEENEKAIIFINRKGFARCAYCQKCGYVLKCDRCSLTLIFHFEEKKLVCNSCGLTKELPAYCPNCNSGYIKYAGFGIEKVINQLNLLFPHIKIGRIDKEHISETFGDFKIIVATEMIFQEKHLPKAKVAAAVDLDSQLNIINFRSNEKIFSLLRRLKDLGKEEIIIQTQIPEYYSSFVNLDIDKFFELELKERKALQLPPFTHLARINLRGKDSERTKEASFDLYEKIKKIEGIDKKVVIFEPAESAPSKLRGNFRFNILLKFKSPAILSKSIRNHLNKISYSKVITTIEVDP